MYWLIQWWFLCDLYHIYAQYKHAWETFDFGHKSSFQKASKFPSHLFNSTIVCNVVIIYNEMIRRTHWLIITPLRDKLRDGVHCSSPVLSIFIVMFGVLLCTRDCPYNISLIFWRKTSPPNPLFMPYYTTTDPTHDIMSQIFGPLPPLSMNPRFRYE